MLYDIYIDMSLGGQRLMIYSPVPSAKVVKPSNILISVVPFTMSQCAKKSRRMEIVYTKKGVALWDMLNWNAVLVVYRK